MGVLVEMNRMASVIEKDKCHVCISLEMLDLKKYVVLVVFLTDVAPSGFTAMNRC